MNANLRPMNLGEILDRTFQIYRAKFLLFVGIAVLPALVMLSVHLADFTWFHLSSLVHPFRQPGIAIWSFIVSLGFYHVSGFLQLLILPALVYLTSSLFLGEGSSIQKAIGFAVAGWRRYLWVAFLKLFAVLVIPEILVVGLIAVAAFVGDRAGAFNGDQSGFAAVLLLSLPIIVGSVLFLWLGSCLSLAIPASAIEGIAGFRALRRSWVLTKGSRLRILFTFLTVAIFSWLLMYGLQLVCRWIYILLFRMQFFGATAQRFYPAEIYLMYAMVAALIGPIYPIALTLFYYDQRIRLEGYDIERMMEEAGLNAPVTTPAEAGEGQA
ncbi:MAG: hypothetical protein ABSE55_16970 [Terracidiphilus sp.]|jgi:hypothetical protein